MNLSKPQKSIYDMEKFVGGSVSNICGSILVDGEISISELQSAVNNVYLINDALRLRIAEAENSVEQQIRKYNVNDIEILHFSSKEALVGYAQQYAIAPIDLHENLCEFKIVILPNKCGIIVKLHHIIGDAWSLSLIGTQLLQFLNGETPCAYSYLDYVKKENDYLQSKRYEKDLKYFSEQFEKCEDVTYLSERKNKTYNAKRIKFTLSKEKTAKLSKYSINKQTTPFILFVMAVALYFNRTKMNAERFYIGIPVLNRNSIEEKNTVGMFINTVPMLIELENDKSFFENIEQIQETVFSIMRHQKCNYSSFLEHLRSNYKFNEKLYDVVLSYQNSKIIGNVGESEWYHCGMQTESLQIHIDDRDNEGVLNISYDYLTDKFSAKDIELLHTHIMNLLFNGIADDCKKLYDVNILTLSEWNKLLYDFNDTKVDYPKDKCVHQLFEEQVVKTPNKIALYVCDKALTYKELNEEANRIAHSLMEKGVGVGDIVAFSLPRKSYLIAAMIGILKAGAAYLPIDPDYPQDRIDYMIEDSNAKFYVTEKNILELTGNNNTYNPNISLLSENICYCIYTSGSTGRPKGVVINHRNVSNFCNTNMKGSFQKTLIGECDCILCINNTIFDITLQETLLPLTNGKEIIFSENLMSLDSITEFIRNGRKYGLIITPSKLEIMLKDINFKKILKNVSVVMIGAEALTNSLLKQIRENTKSIIFNGYGPTETTCGSLYYRIEE